MFQRTVAIAVLGTLTLATTSFAAENPRLAVPYLGADAVLFQPAQVEPATSGGMDSSDRVVSATGTGDSMSLRPTSATRYVDAKGEREARGNPHAAVPFLGDDAVLNVPR